MVTWQAPFTLDVTRMELAQASFQVGGEKGLGTTAWACVIAHVHVVVLQAYPPLLKDLVMRLE